MSTNQPSTPPLERLLTKVINYAAWTAPIVIAGGLILPLVDSSPTDMRVPAALVLMINLTSFLPGMAALGLPFAPGEHTNPPYGWE